MKVHKKVRESVLFYKPYFSATSESEKARIKVHKKVRESVLFYKPYFSATSESEKARNKVVSLLCDEHSEKAKFRNVRDSFLR